MSYDAVCAPMPLLGTSAKDLHNSLNHHPNLTVVNKFHRMPIYLSLDVLAFRSILLMYT